MCCCTVTAPNCQQYGGTSQDQPSAEGLHDDLAPAGDGKIQGDAAAVDQPAAPGGVPFAEQPLAGPSRTGRAAAAISSSSVPESPANRGSPARAS